MFHAVAAAFNRIFTKKVTMQTIRDALATSITPENVNSFLELMGMNMSYTQVQDLVRTTGTAFQGTDAVLQWLCTHSKLFKKIGFVCFTGYGPGYEMSIGEVDIAQVYMLLYNHFGRHWQLANLRNDETGTHYCAISATACTQLFEVLRQSI